MPQVSKIRLSKKTEKDLINSLTLVLSSISKKEDMLLFVDSLLTDTEKLMLAKRLAVIAFINNELTDSQISNALNITRMTVGKLRYFYEGRGKKGYSIALNKINRDKNLQEFKKILSNISLSATLREIRK